MKRIVDFLLEALMLTHKRTIEISEKDFNTLKEFKVVKGDTITCSRGKNLELFIKIK